MLFSEIREDSFPESVPICGVDEAGRGPLAGPLSVALVIFPRDILDKIYAGSLLPGLDDSKKLSEKERESLYEQIILNARLVVHQFVSHKFIDKNGMSLSIYLGIWKLFKKSRLDNPILLIDGNYNFTKHQVQLCQSFEYKSIIKGDSKIASIAAASIIAKVKRDRFMKRISAKYPEYGFEKHKGYGTAMHIKKIKEFGYCKIHRLSFKVDLNDKRL